MHSDDINLSRNWWYYFDKTSRKSSSRSKAYDTTCSSRTSTSFLTNNVQYLVAIMSKVYHDDTWLESSEMPQTPPASNRLADAERAVPNGSDQTKNDIAKSSSSKKYVLYAVILLAIVAIAVGVAIAVTSGDKEEDSSNKAATAPAGSPTPFNDNGTPGPTPTNANEVGQVIQAAAIFGGSEFEDPKSYQSKAYEWVLTQTLPANQYPNLGMEEQARQLYALACIFFGTYAQRNAWTDFHFGEGVALPGWFSNAGWLMRAGDVCEWYGVTCDDQNRVAEIELDTNGLTGEFPPEVQLLKDSLIRLDLYNNLVHNKGDEGNAWLGELTNLEYLFLGTTSFEYDGVPTEIGRLTKLKELDFSYTLYFGKLQEGMWGGLTDLSYLVMDGNAYNSTLPQDLVTLPNLEYLYSGFSFLTGDLEFISQMPKIAEIWVDDNPAFAGTIPVSITTSDTLVSISLTQCALTGTIPTQFGNMTDMIQMWLYGNELSGPIPSELGNMVSMKLLNVQSNDLTGVMPDSICGRRSPFGRLEELEADCDGEVTCPETCCTCCGEQCIDT